MTREAFCRHPIETPFGVAAVIYDTDRAALRRVLLPGHTGPSVTALGKQRLVKSSTSLPVTVRRFCGDLAAYFKGRPMEFTDHLLDLRHFTDLERAVLDAVRRIPYGVTRSYGQIAQHIKRPHAYRFVGTTLGKNPFPVAIPCHRVVRADGSIGGFGGGTDLKRRMLTMEQSVRRKE